MFEIAFDCCEPYRVTYCFEDFVDLIVFMMRLELGDDVIFSDNRTNGVNGVIVECLMT